MSGMGSEPARSAERELVERVGDLLDSRRWRIADRLGSAADRVLGRRRAASEEVRIRELLEVAFRRLAFDTGADDERRYRGPRADLPRYPPFDGRGGFPEYLAHAYLNPEMLLPGTEAEQRMIATMTTLRTRRAEALANRTEAGSRVSVVMPAFNRARTLDRAISSVLAQRYTNFELIVVDDGSTDDTLAVARAHEHDERVRVLSHDRNTGVSAARNRALECVTGDIVAYLDSDNYWDDDYLLLVSGAFEGPEVRCAYTAQWVVYETDAGAIEYRKLRFAPFNRALLENRNYIDLNCYAHRADLIRSHGGFDEEMRRFVDWDLTLRHTRDIVPAALPYPASTYVYSDTGSQLTDAVSLAESTDGMDARLYAPPALPDELARSVVELSGGHRPSGTGTQPGAQPSRGVSVVIPSYGVPDLLRLCVASIRATTASESTEIIVVDNASPAPARGVLDALEREGVQVVRNARNLGFTHAVNQGAEHATAGRDIVVMNNDAVATHGWLEGMQEVLHAVPTAGIVAPRQVLFPHSPTMEDHVPFSKPYRELDVTCSVHHRNVLSPGLEPVRGLVELSFAPFFCVYIPRHVWDALGPLDPQTGPHYRSDRVYCDLVRWVLGCKIVYTPHAKLYHFLQRSTHELRADDEELLETMHRANSWEELTREESPRR